MQSQIFKSKLKYIFLPLITELIILYLYYLTQALES